MKNSRKSGASANTNNSGINPIDNPMDAIDFYMPLPDEVYKKWK